MSASSSAGVTAEQSTFPRETEKGEYGYDVGAVDDFLRRARAAFEGTGPDIASSIVRVTSFPLTRHGYRTDAVDAALARLEDALAARERNRALADDGAAAWVEATRAKAQEVLDRLSRETKARFDRVGILRFGYRVDEVDLVADKIAAYLARGTRVTPEQVRDVGFRMRRHGYREQQVDAVLDAVIGIMLAVR